MKILIFFLLSFVAFAQKDTTIITKKVMIIDSVFYVQTTHTHVSFEKLDTRLLEKVEAIDADSVRRIEENRKHEVEKKELVRLVKEAIKKGYKAQSDNSYDEKINNRIINKIKKENQ